MSFPIRGMDSENDAIRWNMLGKFAYKTQPETEFRNSPVYKYRPFNSLV